MVEIVAKTNDEVNKFPKTEYFFILFCYNKNTLGYAFYQIFMNMERRNFLNTFTFEVTLIILFTLSLGLYASKAVPVQFQIIVFGVIGIVGLIPVARSAGESLRNRKINVDLLAAIALIFSFLSGEWGSMLFINLMLTSARILDIYTKRRARISLESLAKLKPQNAHLFTDGGTHLVPLSEIHVGDMVAINLGEQIPVDGIVIKGSATVDQSSLTGESVPVLRAINDRVLSATVVVSGNIIVQTERVGTETTFERMIKLVESAQDAKTRMKTIAERFASWYITIMLIVAIGLYMVTRNLALVLSVVLVVCADDIAIAIPLAFITSIGAAARQGIIVKGADFLEQFSKITTLIVDKTGTVTMGKMVVQRVQTFGTIPVEKALELSGVICRGSTHPVSKAIIHYIEERGIVCKEPDSFEEIEGRGIRGSKDDTNIIIGRLEFLNESGIFPNDAVAAAIQKEQAQGNNVTLISVNKEIVGVFGLADEIREDVATTITSLKKSGVNETVMLTGDNETVAQAIAKQTGIGKYHAGLLPENKVSLLTQYLGKKKTVAMVGDGVNDAAVLARADIGIAMGGIGSDAAIESADVVLMQDDFSKILELREISRKVLRVARGNFLIWIIANVVGLYFVFNGTFDPPRAAAYNFLTDFIPIINSLRLFYYKKKMI